LIYLHEFVVVYIDSIDTVTTQNLAYNYDWPDWPDFCCGVLRL